MAEQKILVDQLISFSKEDSEGVQVPHDDALLITLRVANFNVKRVLVDGGSSADILFYDAYKKMKLGAKRLKNVDSPCQTPHHGRN